VDANTKLSFISMTGVAVGFAGGIWSQLSKSSIEVEGKRLKKLTTAGWISLGIAAIGLLTSIAAEILRIDIKRSEGVERERRETAQKADDERKQLAARQEIIQNLIQQTNEIIISGQPLTSLTLSLKLQTSDSGLLYAMQTGAGEIRRNAEDVQGGVPRTPFEAMEFEHALNPLLLHLAGQSPSDARALALLKLSTNATLSFGNLHQDIHWLGRDGRPKVSAGFSPASLRGTREGNSTPWVTTTYADTPGMQSTYEISWKLDPVTLWGAIDRANAEIPMTAMLPPTIQFAIFYDSKVLPFAKNNFSSVVGSNFWLARPNVQSKVNWIDPKATLILEIEVNGLQKKQFALRHRISPPLLDDSDDEIEEAHCIVMEFEVIAGK